LTYTTSAKNSSAYQYSLDNGHHHSDHQQMILRPKKVSKVKPFDADSSFSIDGMNNGSVPLLRARKN